MSPASDTSRRAYHEAVLQGKPARHWQRIEATMLAQAVPLTRRMIGVLTRLPINVVTACVTPRLEDKERRYSGLTKEGKAARLRVAYKAVDLPDVPPVEYLELIAGAPPGRTFDQLDLSGFQARPL